MAAHTTGPWVIDDRGQNCLQILAPSKGDGYFAGIASVTQRDAHPSKDVEITHAECRANARLIAAAPDLLESLQGFIQGAEAMGWNTDKARAAIAKATGVQQ